MDNSFIANSVQVLLYFAVLLLLAKPLGSYIAKVYENTPTRLTPLLKPTENLLYRLCSIQPEAAMNWKEYAFSMLLFNLLGILFLYGLQRIQDSLPLNPQHFAALSPDLAFNTAVSFATNTDWQAYAGENTLSYLTQMLGLTVQNFLSAATGLSILMAFIRGLRQRETACLGNFWVDTIRGILYILLPLSVILAIFLVSEGVIQNFLPYQHAELIQSTAQEQIIPMGPVASQVAIKQLGTNGGGFFNANSAHPFENPTPITNFLEMIAILLIPVATCFTFGSLLQNKKQSNMILMTMFIIFIPLLLGVIIVEKGGSPLLPNPIGNMEGKETRFGIINSALWAAATTASSNGSVNASLDSFLPLGGLVPLWFINLGEVIFGGVGSGLYQMLIFVILTVFVSGLMIGRTPEYLGKKIESFEIKMASVAILIMPMTVLLTSGMSMIIDTGKSAILNPGPHGFTEILYAFSSMTNNNGSAFAGLNATTPFYNTLGGISILLGRYFIAVAVLAIAGSLSQKKKAPISSGTLPTEGPLFITILVCVILIIGALTFLPALALGPIAEQLMMQGTP